MFFFFNDPSTPEIYTLSLHDALPILQEQLGDGEGAVRTYEHAERLFWEQHPDSYEGPELIVSRIVRSEEHTSELQSQSNLVCRLLLEKKKKKIIHLTHSPA